MAKNLGINPWLKMWVEPRKTIRTIVNFDPKYRFAVLSGIYGFPMMLHIAQNLNLSDYYVTGGILIVALLLSVFAGMLGITITSALLSWTGKWIGGKAPFLNIRAAVGWSNIPNIINIVMWLIMIAHFGGMVFNRNFPQMPFMGGEMLFVLSIFLVQFIMAIWSFVMLLISLSEVQGFSAWKALLNMIIPSVMVIIVVWVVMFIMSGITAVQ